MKVTAFWDVTPWKWTDVSEVRIAGIIRMIALIIVSFQPVSALLKLIFSKYGYKT
jgi:hypothetical protein